MIVLSKDEIEVITGYKRHSAQCNALQTMKIMYEPRLCDGFPLVLRRYYEKRMGFEAVEKPQEKRIGVNLARL